ncbi:hypothetical protein K491DRAFT_369050 [Lophiostoma macrostomum CBS 122681]|uniref:PPPDE domain-containing protein n=1 Tax=Lophiostoma macrostomum CBS 122681 TaxID=1314788 RepID=A0A6A6TCC9_9PLEO|nr:hypothetical protein K491DRAFT_369050 [Lophiostoma macrostomum CBS 122681]
MGLIKVSNIQQLKTKQEISLLIFPHFPPHFCLFLPGQEKNSKTVTGTVGFLYDIEAASNSQKLAKSWCCIPRRATYYWNKKSAWDLNLNAPGTKVIRLAGARCTAEQMDFATNKVFLNLKYHFVKENCHTFAIEVLRCLNTWYNNAVPAEAMQIVMGESNAVTRKCAERRARRLQFSDTTRPRTDPAEEEERRPVRAKPVPKRRAPVPKQAVPAPKKPASAPPPAWGQRPAPARRAVENRYSDPGNGVGVAPRRKRRDYEEVASETLPGRHGDKRKARVGIPGGWVE